MKPLWNMCNRLQVKPTVKKFIYIMAMILFNGMIGGLVWSMVARIILPEIEWCILFVGWSAMVLGLYGSIVYLMNHEFA